MKIIEPPGAQRTDPCSFGAVTQAAIALPKIEAPHRLRTFALALTNDDVSGERPSRWSAALDQSAAGVAPGDEALDAVRLIVVAAGNVPDDATPDDLSDPDEYPIEDPAQAWNVVSVDGFTDKCDLDPNDSLSGWNAYTRPGDQSPYSRASTDWPHSHTPIKPDIVYEAGNRALSPSGSELTSGVDSLSLLSTGSAPQRPLDLLWATSAATAQVARHATMIRSRYPGYWPETVRALMVHSARWSPAMLEVLVASSKPGRRGHLRRFGYGIPSLERAPASARSDLALVAENSLQPYKRETGKNVAFNDAHFYRLPWPVAALESLGSTAVELKVTLSYLSNPARALQRRWRRIDTGLLV